MDKSIVKLIKVPVNAVSLEGLLNIPNKANSIVLFAHGSGSSRLSPRNNYVAKILQSKGLGTLLIDLLTPEEDLNYQTRFDIHLLTDRLLIITKWLEENYANKNLSIGYFGASTGAAAALNAASRLGNKIKAVVSRGGRPDLATNNLEKVQAPVLLIVGGHDPEVIKLNQLASRQLKTIWKLKIIAGASHLFEEPGALEKVARLSARWFKQYL